MKLSFLFPSKVSLLRDWDGGDGSNATAKLSPFQETVIQQMAPGSMENWVIISFDLTQIASLFK